MDQEINESSIYGSSRAIDYMSVVRDVLRNWLVIVLISLAVSLAAGAFTIMRYSPRYTSSVTLVVQGNSRSSVFNNSVTAKTVSTNFSALLESDIMKKAVARDLGMKSFSGSTSANVISGTNLMQLSVTAGSSKLAFEELSSILRCYPEYSSEAIGNVILQTLEAPTVPTSPNNALNFLRPMMMAFVAAAVLLIALFALISASRDTIRNEGDVERKLDTRLLVSIAHEEKYKTIGARIRKKKTSILITDSSVSFRYVETIRKLAHRVIERMEKKGAKTILVTSVMEDEGKSTVAVNLAMGMAQENKKVLLIDCDFRKPSLYKIMNRGNEKFEKLGKLLHGENTLKGLVIKDPSSNLSVILNSQPFRNSTELIASDRFKMLLNVLKPKFDYIVVDTSPMALVPDAEEFAGILDSSLIVVRQHLIEASVINDYIDVLNAGHHKMVGCVFNNVYSGGLFGRQSGGYGYGYGYGYGSHYEKNYEKNYARQNS
ncbi:MAG: polysaccharide biosynthesis tyrosine autokinase [Lachnospiraceae bacterium]|nr:polysaccharide biosynthesis tyrosine autokinase [Lachnospiraceae bacterium]